MKAQDETSTVDETAVPRHSRRAIIGGGLAGAAGTGIAGALLATASPAGAAPEPDGSPMLLGESNQATDTTSLQNTNGTCLAVSAATGQPVILATDTSTTNTGGSTAVYGQSNISAGVVGTSQSNAGVVGTSTSGPGVVAQSLDGDAVNAALLETSTTAGIAAVFALDPTSVGNTAVEGQSDNGTGVFGVANVGGGSGGTGVYGQCYGDGGVGVGGGDASIGGGFGVVGTTTNGVAVNGYIADVGTGLGLQILGPSQFATAGTAVVPKGTSSVTVDVGYVSPGNLVLATVQTPAPGRYVTSAVAGNSTVTINLDSKTHVDCPVGYLALVPYGVGAAAPAAARTMARARARSRTSRNGRGPARR